MSKMGKLCTEWASCLLLLLHSWKAPCMEVMGLFPADREIVLGQGRGNSIHGKSHQISGGEVAGRDVSPLGSV